MGFPHSEIFGSKCVGNSPKLIAACHVLHRLSVPRHPPNALVVLDLTFCQRNDDFHRHHGSFRAGDDPHPRKRPCLPFLLLRLILLSHRHNKFWRRSTENLDFKDLILPINDVKERTRHQRCLVFYAARFHARVMVEADGIEPTTSCLQSRRSPN